MSPFSGGKTHLFYGIRLRHAVALLACLAVVLILAGYFSVSAGKKAAFDAVTAQGRALTETLISSAEMIIEADNEFVELGLERLSTIVAGFDSLGIRSDEAALEELLRSADAERVSSVEDMKVTASVSAGISSIATPDIESWLETLRIDPEAEILYEFRSVDGKRYFWGYFPADENDGIFLAGEWKFGQYGNEKLSLYYLLNLVGREAGVEYIMLQNPDGIVFASKKIASMKAISDDPFLMETGDTTRSRIITFQDREVLETVKKFKYDEFDGLFRVGLSLYGYSQISGSMRRQVWLVVAALIILGMIGFGAVVGFQNFDLLKANFEKASLMSQSLLDSLPGPFVAVDAGLRITDMNASARSVFGIQAPLLSSYETVFPDDPLHLTQVLKGNRTAGFESSLGTAGYRFFVTATPLVGEGGLTIGAIAMAQDITDTRKLEQMADSRKRLSEMGALAASMAHEIRNPLNAIGITIQRMKSEIKPSEREDEYRKFLDGLKMEIGRLNSVIEKFLAVARSARPKYEQSSLNTLIGDVVALYSDQASSRRLNFKWNPKADIAAEIDKDSIKQALVNIVKNSIEAVPEGGNIEIELGSSGDKVKISVVDNGPGIDDTSLAMKPFHTTKEGGTGLGLATASTILADHGGELVIQSSSGGGCRVDMIFPAERNDL